MLAALPSDTEGLNARPSLKAMAESSVEAENATTSIAVLHASLLTRASKLLAELSAFELFLQSQKKENEVEIRQFRCSVQSELKSLQRLSSGFRNTTDATEDIHVDPEAAKRTHILRSSNLPFYEAVWTAARGCRGVRALAKRVHYSSIKESTCEQRRPLGHNGFTDATGGSSKKHSVLLDIVSDDGSEWIKVSTITDRRLLFEMAKDGWEAYGDESEPEADTSGGENSKWIERSGRLELLKLAEDMKHAARRVRVRYRHPRIRFILPKISEGVVEDLDTVLADLRATGALVQCGGRDTELTSEIDQLSIREGSGSHMLPSLLSYLKRTMNIDCTILLALISDISHILEAELPPPSNGAYHSAITHQIVSETISPLLPTELYPIIAGRRLVCTYHAARRMREIVDTMGTPVERLRAEILLGEGAMLDCDAEQLRDHLTRLSSHPVPSSLELPIKVVDFDVDAVLGGQMPANLMALRDAQVVCDELRLSDINKSVFLYGWDAGIVTVTSNRVVAAGIEKVVGTVLDRAEGRSNIDQLAANGEPVPEGKALGPEMWICGTARSLIGKEKMRREG